MVSFLRSRNHGGTYGLATFQHPQHDSLASAAVHPTANGGCSPLSVLVHIASFAADEGLINLDLSAEISAGEIVLHGKAHAVE
jgi:hypothetical protein